MKKIIQHSHYYILFT